MSYFPRTKIELADSPAVDAFGKLRVSEAFTVFESKQIADAQSLIWATKNVSGSSTTHSQPRASTILYVTATSGSRCIRQSKQNITYQAAKSQMILMTGVFGSPVVGIKKKIGYFNDNNGLFFMQDSGSFKIVKRSSVTGVAIDTEVSQSQWNIDKLDGTGTSRLLLNSTQAQIFVTDFQWLGTGRCRLGFDISGSVQYVHEFNHANLIDSVYMSTPNLPLRYEIDNVSGSSTTGSLEHICCSVTSEGGREIKGFMRSADRYTSSLVNVTASNPAPIISIRLGTTSAATVLVENFSVMAEGNANFRWGLHLNPIIRGTVSNAKWIATTGSSVQYDVSRNVTNYVSGGILLRSGYVASLARAASIDMSTSGFENTLLLGKDVDGVSDEIVLSVQSIGPQSNYYASLTWREF